MLAACCQGGNPREIGKQTEKCTEAILYLGTITMLVVGILGAVGVLAMAPAAAYALIGISSSILGLTLLYICAKLGEKAKATHEKGQNL